MVAEGACSAQEPVAAGRLALSLQDTVGSVVVGEPALADMDTIADGAAATDGADARGDEPDDSHGTGRTASTGVWSEFRRAYHAAVGLNE